MRALITAFGSLPLHPQLAVVACVLCLLSNLALVGLAAQSSSHTQASLQDAYGQAVVEQLARRLSTEMAAGDRLGIAGELSRLVDQDGISSARVVDTEARELAAAGKLVGQEYPFRATVLIAGDQAGVAEVALNTATQDSTRFRFLLSLSGLAVLLSIGVFAATRTLASRLGKNLQAVTDELGGITESGVNSGNEVQALKAQVASLPLELLKTPGPPRENQDEHYVDTTLVFIHFRSLPGYVDTVDEQRLQRYVAHIHRMVYGAAGFYAGQLEVVRQLGVAVWFSGSHPIASPAVRAASCAWLIQQSTAKLEQRLRLSVGLGLAIGGSELGRGDDQDIYPGLYTQASVDELQELAAQAGADIRVSAFVLQDLDFTTRVATETRGDQHILSGFSAGHRDLVERQRAILSRALFTEEAADQADSF